MEGNPCVSFFAARFQTNGLAGWFGAFSGLDSWDPLMKWIGIRRGTLPETNIAPENGWLEY